MQIGFLVRKLESLDASLSTMHLMAAACNAGHDVLVCEASAFSQLDAGPLLLPGVWLRSKRRDLTSRQVAGAVLAKAQARKNSYDLSTCGILFPRLIWSPEELNSPTLLNLLARLEEQGVHMVNSADTIRRFATAHHWAEFPADIRPVHLITRELSEALAWLDREGEPDVYARTLHHRTGAQPLRFQRNDEQRQALLTGLLAQDAVTLYELRSQAPEKRILWMDGKILGGYAMRTPAWTGRNAGADSIPFISDMNEAEAAVYLQVEPVLKSLRVNLAMIAIVDGTLAGIEAMAAGGIDCIDRLYNCRIESNIIRQAVRQWNQRATPATAPTA